MFYLQEARFWVFGKCFGALGHEIDLRRSWIVRWRWGQGESKSRRGRSNGTSANYEGGGGCRSWKKPSGDLAEWVKRRVATEELAQTERERERERAKEKDWINFVQREKRRKEGNTTRTPSSVRVLLCYGGATPRSRDETVEHRRSSGSERPRCFDKTEPKKKIHRVPVLPD